jgi:hypothetical protein
MRTAISRGARQALPVLTVALIAVLSPRIAPAALGGNVATVEADRAHMKAAVRKSQAAGYEVHQLVTPEGTTVQEYVAPSGTVFAVSWRGPFMPDLRQTLGSYFEVYRNAPRTAGSTRSRAAIDQPQLVVHSQGHMRYYAGIAYVPSLLPSGVTPDELR